MSESEAGQGRGGDLDGSNHLGESVGDGGVDSVLGDVALKEHCQSLRGGARAKDLDTEVV